MKKLKYDDWQNMDYFHNDRGDLERWCDWESRKEEIRKINPDLVKAFEEMKYWERQFNSILDNSEAEEEE